jgi:SAM-dependent methyltransferase
LSLIGDLYNKVYNKICGVHPNLYPWHFQWLGGKALYADLKAILPSLKGRVLDVGCGDRPYESWLVGADEYIGIDIRNGPKVDFVIDHTKPWPLDDDTFDVVLCTQVLEHVPHTEQLLRSIQQVMKPGGVLIVTAPFIYNAHGIPEDYHRFSVYGMEKLLSESFEIVETKSLGGIGSTVGILCLNWLETMTTGCKLLRLLKGLFLPLWIPFCFLINLTGWLMDKMDRTQAFYSNILLVAKKPHKEMEGDVR